MGSVGGATAQRGLTDHKVVTGNPIAPDADQLIAELKLKYPACVSWSSASPDISAWLRWRGRRMAPEVSRSGTPGRRPHRPRQGRARNQRAARPV